MPVAHSFGYFLEWGTSSSVSLSLLFYSSFSSAPATLCCLAKILCHVDSWQ